MTGWSPPRWPLRARVALAFLGTSTIALAGLGVFVHVRMSDALDERLRDTVTAEADRLEAMSPAARRGAVDEVGGDLHAQAVGRDGALRASSPRLDGPLLGRTALLDLTAGGRSGYTERSAEVLDDDATTTGGPRMERENLLLRVRSTADGFLVVATSREDADEALAQLRNQLLVGGPLALGLAGALGYVVAGAGLRPIERMRSRAATISDRSAGERLPLPDADDELRRLALTLNAMLERLDAALQRERSFVAEAGHDLRTPLTLMLTEIELALARPREADHLTVALRSVQDEVRRLISLAEDLLGRAGTEGPALRIESAPVDLTALATRVAERFRTAAGDRAVTVHKGADVTVQGDLTRLDRAVSNLVDNALRHGAGPVTVEVSAGDRAADVTVSDEGGGFVPPSAPSAPSGTDGLGLAIVDAVARAHGGSVEVTNVDGHTRVTLRVASPDP